ncbi:MAG TPA: DUF2232 domain-containing protein [Peptococcaceae bacterium]|nr:DUF2232 domain-containing protein [Peptococcaceae bacterium]
MYISDKDALLYASRLLLLLVPFFSSFFTTWSWLIEILLLVALFIHCRNSGLRLSALFLGLGYLAAFIPVGVSGFSQIGFVPWAGVIFLALKEKGFDFSHSIFWGLIAAALLSALPVIPMLKEFLQPEVIQKNIDSLLQLYKEQGTLNSLEEQGVSLAELKKYLQLAMPIYYQLMPAFSSIIGFLEFGVAYLTIRFSLKKIQKTEPFDHFRLPWYEVWFTICGLAAYLGGDYLGVEALRIAGINIMAVMAAISLVLGFACLVYLMKHPKLPRFMVWIFILIGVFFPYLLLGGLVIVGLFDPVLNLRKIPEKSEGGKQ